MAHFPLFVDLQGKKCLVVGGGNVALRKARALLEYGASVIAVAPQFSKEFAALSGNIVFAAREFEPQDISGAALVCAATNDSDCNRLVHRLCAAQNIPINVADIPGLCTFCFPALVRRGDVVLGISTSGKSPALARALRERIDSLLPQALSDLAQRLGSLRARLLCHGEHPAHNEEYNALLREARLFCLSSDLQEK